MATVRKGKTMPFTIELSRSAAKSLNAIRVFERRTITDSIDRQLVFEPDVETRNRKCLVDAIPPFEHVPPLWELRVGEFRVYYDVNVTESVVSIRAVRRKPPHKTTDQVLNEKNDD
jgi:mRNA-degrading endonuclease RelE of RelBE toxin-antitoxin system